MKLKIEGTGQKSFVFGGLVILTIIILIAIPAVWIGLGQFTNKSTGESVSSVSSKIIFTLVGLALLFFGWWNYYRQKRIDKTGQKDVIGDKVMSTVYKASGWYARVRAIAAWIVSGILFIIAIAVFAGAGSGSSTARIIFGLVSIALAIWAIVYGFIYWYRSKSLVKGRFY
mgnify:CR=1 FL=1